MTLRFFNKKNKPDTREVEYNQSMVQLGLERATLEREVGSIREEIVVLNTHRNNANLEIKEKAKELSEYDKKLNTIREDIAAELKKGSISVDSQKTEEEKIKQIVEKKQTEIGRLQEHLNDLNLEVENKNQKLADLQKVEAVAREELARVQLALSQAKRELEVVSDDVQASHRANKKVQDTLEAAKVDLDEVLAQVESLKRNNRGGLDAIASLEAERARLKEKDDFLCRKEADLLVYENRLAKRIDEAGADIKMTFK